MKTLSEMVYDWLARVILDAIYDGLIATSLEWWSTNVNKGSHLQICRKFQFFQASELLSFSRIVIPFKNQPSYGKHNL